MIKQCLATTFVAQDARRVLNGLLHPRIALATAREAARLAEHGEPLGCYEAALLVENGVADAFRPLVVVAAPEDLQVQRARQRDGSSEEEARARIAAQKPLSEKRAAADVVIENDGDIEALEARADAALDEVAQRCGVDPSRYRR